MKILIVDADIKTAELECDYLQADGFECEVVANGETGLKMAQEGDFLAVITEVALSGKDGFSLCKELRQTKDIPIIFVTDRCEEIDKIRGFSIGADDYITKPFSPTELVARVKAHIARYERFADKNSDKEDSVLTIRGLSIYKDARRVYVDGKEISMPVKEYELLLFLAENPNIVFSKERLFDRIWGMDAMGDVSTVTVHIQRIREKIEQNKTGNKYIETVWGAGYRFL